MLPDDIKVQQTYRAATGRLFYVQDIYSHTLGQRVTRRVVWNIVGNVTRSDSTLAGFAKRMTEVAPNQ